MKNYFPLRGFRDVFKSQFSGPPPHIGFRKLSLEVPPNLKFLFCKWCPSIFRGSLYYCGSDSVSATVRSPLTSRPVERCLLADGERAKNIEDKRSRCPVSLNWRTCYLGCLSYSRFGGAVKRQRDLSRASITNCTSVLPLHDRVVCCVTDVHTAHAPAARIQRFRLA